MLYYSPTCSHSLDTLIKKEIEARAKSREQMTEVVVQMKKDMSAKITSELTDLEIAYKKFMQKDAESATKELTLEGIRSEAKSMIDRVIE